MSNPEDPVRPNRVDGDGTFSALDQFPVERPTGSSPPTFELRTGAFTTTEPRGVAFPGREIEPQPPLEAIAAWAAAEAPAVESTGVEPEPFTPRRDNAPWLARPRRPHQEQPEAVPAPMPRARTLSPAPPVAPELPAPGPEPPSRDLTDGLFAAVGDDADGPPKAERSAA